MDNFYNTGTNTRINPAAVKIPPTTMRSLSEIAVRDEAKEVWPEARPKTTQMVADRSPRNRIEPSEGHEVRGSGIEERAEFPTGSLRPSL
jgi:hypothetical protein